MATERVTCFREHDVATFFGNRPWIPSSRLSLSLVCSHLRTIESGGGTQVLDRPDADKADGWRHIGTYTLINVGGLIASYRRGSSGGEGRLHGKISIGFGGHYTVDEQPAEVVVSVDSITNAAAREVDEEVKINNDSESRYVGMILSSESSVDRVHIGLCFERCVSTVARSAADLGRNIIEPAEDCIKEIKLEKFQDINTEECETWTKILLANMRKRPITTYF